LHFILFLFITDLWQFYQKSVTKVQIIFVIPFSEIEKQQKEFNI